MIEIFKKDVNNIQALSDEPNITDGLSADELRAKFDQAGADLKEYINETLVPAVNEKAEAETVGEISELARSAKSDAQSAIHASQLASRDALSAQRKADNAADTAESAALEAEDANEIAQTASGKADNAERVASSALSLAQSANERVTILDGEVTETRRYVDDEVSRVAADAEELIQDLDGKKQNRLVPGSNVKLSPQEDGTVRISASGGGGGGLSPEQEEKLNNAASVHYVNSEVQGAVVYADDLAMALEASKQDTLSEEQMGKINSAATTAYVDTAIANAINGLHALADEILGGL